MVNLSNFINNHLATVYAHPVNAARLQAQGFTLQPAITSPLIQSTPTMRPAVAFTQHFFVAKPQQPFDATRKTK